MVLAVRGCKLGPPSLDYSRVLPLRRAFRTRTRTIAVATIESRTTAPPPAVTIRGCVAAADAAPPAVGMVAM